MARPTKGVGHVDALTGDPVSKRRLKVMLLAIPGLLSVNGACEALDICTAYFNELRTRVLASALVGIQPRRIGRPRKAPTTPEEVAELVRENAELRREVAILRAQVDVAVALAGPLQSPAQEPGHGKSRGRRPRRQAAAAR